MELHSLLLYLKMAYLQPRLEYEIGFLFNALDKSSYLKGSTCPH